MSDWRFSEGSRWKSDDFRRATEAPLRPPDSGRAVGHWMRALGRMSAMTKLAAQAPPFKGSAYGSHRNQALALPSVGIEASPARENRKRIRRRIRLFRHATPYRPPIGNGRRNRPDDPAPGRDGISTDSTHPPIPVGIVVVPYLRNAPVRRFSAPLAGFRPKRRRMGRASPPSAPTGPPTGYGAPPAPKRGDPLRPRRIVPGSRRRIRRW